MPIDAVSFRAPLIASSDNFEANLSPDALMVYLQTRLDGLDEQVNTIFNDQKRQQQAQSILRDISASLGKLDDKNGGGFDKTGTGTHVVDVDNGDGTMSQSVVPNEPDGSIFKAEVEKKIASLEEVDPALAAKVRDTLTQEGQILEPGKGNSYTSTSVGASNNFLNGIGKDLESQASLNMIHLQSIMSSRQTAVQLATNMVSSLGESTKAIVTNIGH